MNRPDWIGQTLSGRYEIQEVIGQGGMSSVFKALDPNLQRVVAIKMIHPHLSSDPKFTARFEEEARAVARLRHPNIVQVYDFNHDGPVYYMVQEYVPGETLQSLLRRLHDNGQMMPIQDALRYTAEICSAIDYAHHLGMIHRDIKPANVMIDERGQAILMDFGIVKLLEGDSHTTTGTVVGTVSYMAPDLIRGEPPDARSDIYSLGVTLFEMLCGRLPFQSDSAITLMMMHQNEQVPDLHTLRKDAPDDLIAIVQKALAKTRDERYSTAAEMGGALDRVSERMQHGEPAYAVHLDSLGAPSPAGKQEITSVQPGRGQTAAPAGPPPRSGETGVPGSEAQAQLAPLPPMKRTSLLLSLGAVAVVLLAVLVVGALALRGNSGKGSGSQLSPTAALATPAVAAVSAPTAASGLTPPPLSATQPAATQPTAAPTAEAQAAPSQPVGAQSGAPAAALPPTPNVPSDIPYAQVTKIVVDSQDHYVVSFDLLNQDKGKPDDRIDFFYNTAPRNDGGFPLPDYVTIYSGPSPFAILNTATRPKDASQMCALVALADSTMLDGSGNCVSLPNVNSVLANTNIKGYSGPGTDYPQASILPIGASTLVEGISADEAWWYVMDPENPKNFFWVPRDQTTFTGNLATVKLVSPSVTPTSPPAADAPSVQITSITLDAQNEYVVNYVTRNYTPALPGTHMHFFFNTTPADQVGASGGGNRLMFAGPPPFTGYKVSDRPAGADAICVLVANPDHTVQPDSGNCFPLP